METMKSNFVQYGWQQLCEQQVEDIYDHYYEWYDNLEKLETVNPLEAITSLLEYLCSSSDGLTKPITPQILNSLSDNPLFFDIAGYSLFMIDHASILIDRHFITNILINKQKDYGVKNIMMFGLSGIIVRMYDKIARLENLIQKSGGNLFDAEQANAVHGESIIDTLIDIVGYSTIGLMIMTENNTHGNNFLTPMTPDETHQNITNQL
jgi:hypothetical protein